MGFLKEGNMLIGHESGLNNGLCQMLTELGTGMARQMKGGFCYFYFYFFQK